MKKIKLSLVAVALLGTVAAFASRSGDSFSYEDENSNPISQSQYLACPNTSVSLCGQKIDDDTQEVVETRKYNH